MPDAVPDPAAPSRPVGPRRALLLDAALRVVAESGLRGLTHRAVDRAAGLPEGSCSAYLRTRRALQGALAEHVVAALAEDVRALAASLADGPHEPVDHDRALAATRQLFLDWLRERALLQAKLELSLEATRDAALAVLLATSRDALVEVVAGLLGGTGTESGRNRAEALVAACDGVLVAALLRPAAEREAFVSRSVSELLTGLSATVVPPAAPAARRDQRLARGPDADV